MRLSLFYEDAPDDPRLSAFLSKPQKRQGGENFWYSLTEDFMADCRKYNIDSIIVPYGHRNEQQVGYKSFADVGTGMEQDAQLSLVAIDDFFPYVVYFAHPGKKATPDLLKRKEELFWVKRPYEESTAVVLTRAAGGKRSTIESGIRLTDPTQALRAILQYRLKTYGEILARINPASLEVTKQLLAQVN